MARGDSAPTGGETWVFGYGSLIWRADFPWLARQPAALAGWARRFWQGSHDHRGVATAPGRVVTLIRAPGETCVGMAYRVEAPILEDLDHREKNGYERLPVTLALHEPAVPNVAEATATESASDAPVQGIAYVAHPGNHAFLGDAPLESMAWQIRQSAGPSGRNLDYLLELARALRELGAEDAHVFALEAAVLRRRPA